MKRGQMWSVDVIIGVIIFVSVILVFYTTLNQSGNDLREVLESNADSIVAKFSTDPEVQIIGSENELNFTKLEELANMSYEDLKRKFGVNGEFCIYVEDEDGRIVPIGNKTSIGNGDINVSGTQCGSDVS